MFQASGQPSLAAEKKGDFTIYLYETKAWTMDTNSKKNIPASHIMIVSRWVNFNSILSENNSVHTSVSKQLIQDQ
jgi:hypothetical protein